MNKKSMEEFVKENGTYDEKEDSYFFSCSQADVVKEDIDLSHEAFGMKVIITKNGFGINAYFVEDELARAAESLKISVKDIMEFGDSAVQLVQEELKNYEEKRSLYLLWVLLQKQVTCIQEDVQWKKFMILS